MGTYDEVVMAGLERACEKYPDKAPQYVEFRDMLPKSKVGKLLRREVREEERRRLEKDKRPVRV